MQLIKASRGSRTLNCTISSKTMNLGKIIASPWFTKLDKGLLKWTPLRLLLLVLGLAQCVLRNCMNFGLANYYNEFIQGFSTIAAPAIKMLITKCK